MDSGKRTNDLATVEISERSIKRLKNIDLDINSSSESTSSPMIDLIDLTESPLNSDDEDCADNSDREKNKTIEYVVIDSDSGDESDASEASSTGSTWMRLAAKYIRPKEAYPEYKEMATTIEKLLCDFQKRENIQLPEWNIESWTSSDSTGHTYKVTITVEKLKSAL